MWFRARYETPIPPASLRRAPLQRELGGKCGSAAFTLEDDTGSIEVAVRRSHRLIEPLREGDRVQVSAQVEVFRSRDNKLLRVCVEAREIQHLIR